MRKIVLSEQMLAGEITRATIELARLMRGEWRDSPFDLIERSCEAFAERYVAQLVERNLEFKASDLEVLS